MDVNVDVLKDCKPCCDKCELVCTSPMATFCLEFTIACRSCGKTVTADAFPRAVKFWNSQLKTSEEKESSNKKRTTKTNLKAFTNTAKLTEDKIDALAAELKELIKNTHITGVVFSAVGADDIFTRWTSGANYLMLLGGLEFAKTCLLKEMVSE